MPALASGVVALALLVPAAVDLGPRRASADRHADTAASVWLDTVLPSLKPNAVVVSWWWTSTPLWYASLVEGRRPDITVIDDRTVLDLGYGTALNAIAHFEALRPVYVLRANSADLAGSGTLAVFEVGPGSAPG